MRLFLSLSLVLLIGCPKTGSTTSGPSHPELVCAEGAEPTGAVPPHGRAAWCRRVTPEGSWDREGTYIEWHENNQKAAQGLYRADKRSGPWTFWFPTGQVEKQGTYRGGVEDSYWVSFHADGERAAEGQMVDGKEHGPWLYWSEDGLTRTEGQWKMGKQDGVWTVYDTSDTPVAEQVYRAGRLISKREL